MKKIAVVLVLICFAVQLRAQLATPGWGNLDYNIPESPAFKILGNNPDNIIKPTSVRNVAVSVGNYFATTGSVLPQNFAVEISPLLLNSKASLNDYNAHTFWYRLRLSAGTALGNDGSYRVGEGLRLTLIDKTDLRDRKSNPNFFDFLYASAVDGSVANDKALADYAAKHPGISHIELGEKYQTDTAFKNMINKDAVRFYTNKNIQADAVAAYRDSVRELLWNAPIWEMGIATLQSSKDSLIKNLSFSQIAFWTSAGFPVGKKGQLLLGGKFGVMDSTSWQPVVSVGERFYYGSNNVTGFVQGEYDYRDKKSIGVASLGCHFSITNGLWGQFSINLVIEDSKVSYQPGFSLGFGTPEKKE